jgi:hypothetical protein
MPIHHLFEKGIAMSKDVQMTFRVEPELRAEFTDAASRDHRPAAQVLREFMRAYVADARERQHASANGAISLAERRRRENAVNFARSSVGLEGFVPSEAEEERARRFVNGEIQLAEFVRAKADTDQTHNR